MSGKLSLQDISALYDLERSLREFSNNLGSVLVQAEREIRQAQEWIAERIAYWQRETERAQVNVQRAEFALRRCEASGYRDSEGHYHQPDCSSERHHLEQAIQHLRTCSDNLEQTKAWRSRIFQAVQEYQREIIGLKDLLGPHTQQACSFLRDIAGKYEQVRQAAGSVGAGVFGVELGSALASAFGGHHGAAYRKARQEFLRGLLDDPNQPSYVRGWIKQELNRLDRIREAKDLGLEPPGGNPHYIRGIPGLDVGHTFHDLDLASSFRLEDIFVNRGRSGRAARIGSWMR